MKYHFRDGVVLDKKKPTWIFWLIGLVILLGGGYMGAQYMAPQLISMPLSATATPDATMQKMESTKPGNEPHLYVPQLNVDLPVQAGGDHGSLASGAWQSESSAAPDKNDAVLVLRASYFELGLTPWETRERSPFYNLDKLQIGDEVYLDFKEKRYAFVIKKTNESTFDENAKNTDKKAKLVLIPTTSGGDTAKNTIVIAESKGVVTDVPS